MRPYLLIPLLVSLYVVGCAVHRDDGIVRDTVALLAPRVSDKFKCDQVSSYRVFHSRIPGHQLGQFIMKDATQMPMLCKSDNGQIYPLPQSVFANNEGWQIMVEPEIVRGTAHSHSLMQLSVRVEGDAVLMGTTKLKPVTPLPELISNPHEPQRGSP